MNIPKMNRNMWLLWQGQLVSQLGTHAFNIARLYWLIEVMGQRIYAGCLLAACSLILTVLYPVGGYAADFYDRKKIIVLADIVSGLAILALTYSLFRLEAESAQILVLFLASGVVSASSAFFTPAVQASIPNMVPHKQLARANAFIGSSFHIGQIIGQGIGGTLIVIFGIPMMILMNGVSFLLSALTELFITFQQTSSGRDKKKEFRKEGMPHIIRAILEGYHTAKKHPITKQLIFYNAWDGFLLMPLFVITPALAADIYQEGVDYYGYMIALFSSGMLAGYAVVPWLSRNLAQNMFWFHSLFFFKGIAMLSVAMFSYPAVGLTAYFLIGFASAIIGVQIGTYVQTNTDQAILGRVLGIKNGLSSILIPLSFVSAGMLLDIDGLGVDKQFLIYGVLSLILTGWMFRKGVFSDESWYKFQTTANG